MREVDYKDRTDEVNAVHLALRAVGMNVTYLTSDLIYMSMKVVNEKGLQMDLRDTCAIQLKHERKWDDYFRDKEKEK